MLLFWCADSATKNISGIDPPARPATAHKESEHSTQPPKYYSVISLISHYSWPSKCSSWPLAQYSQQSISGIRIDCVRGIPLWHVLLSTPSDLSTSSTLSTPSTPRTQYSQHSQYSQYSQQSISGIRIDCVGGNPYLHVLPQPTSAKAPPSLAPYALSIQG
jgi:hypothetical protein